MSKGHYKISIYYASDTTKRIKQFKNHVIPEIGEDIKINGEPMNIIQREFDSDNPKNVSLFVYDESNL